MLHAHKGEYEPKAASRAPRTTSSQSRVCGCPSSRHAPPDRGVMLFPTAAGRGPIPLLRRRPANIMRRIAAVRRRGIAWVLLASLGWSSCVEVDPKTGETIPRGNQKFFYSHVTEQAKKLEKGMTKREFMRLVGARAR